ncbi:MAG: tetratricopeptide repeat protein [Deltaproteobacteria bacterium]|nr:tetratricopeptide repeat protein [Deltaproteobacteria bacterium]
MRCTILSVLWSLGLCLGCARSAAAPAEPGPGTGPANLAVEPQVVAGESIPATGLAHEDARRIDHLARSRELERAGDTSGALAEARRAAFDRPDRQSLESVARLAGKRQDRPLVVFALQNLARQAPNDPDPLLRLARLHLEKPTEAAAAAIVAMQAVERDPRCAEGWHLKGRADLQRGAVPEAIGAFERAVRLDPRRSWAWNNLGYARLLAGRPEQAVPALERARQLAPHLAYVVNNLGAAYEALGRVDEAQRAYGKALELEPDHPGAAANFARAAEMLGWSGPSVESGRPDAGSVGADWEAASEEYATASVSERSWLLQESAKGPGDEPSGWDLREEAREPLAGFSASAGERD